MEAVSGDSWSYKTYKAPVKMSPPTSQHPVGTGKETTASFTFSLHLNYGLKVNCATLLLEFRRGAHLPF